MKKLCMIFATLLVAMGLFVGCANSTPEDSKPSETASKMDDNASSPADQDNQTNAQDSQTNAQDSTIENESDAGAPEVESAGSEYDVIPETYSYSLTVSINPLVELFFDADNTVVGVSYLNADAVDAYKDVELVGSNLNNGMELLVNAASDKGYLKEEATVTIELAKVSEEAEETFDTVVLVEASQTVNEVIEVICEEKEIVIEAKVEISVNESVEEQVGVTAPVLCTDCNGTGNNCKECNGTSIVRCKRCVDGQETCGTCHGSATIVCHGCHGAGGDCTYCGGTGVMACDACHGQGTFLCSWCKGELRHICPECWGEGTCPTCGGDGMM